MSRAALVAGEASGATSLSVISDLPNAWALADAWNHLAEATSAQPTVLPSYALHWWEHCGQGDLHLLVAHRGDELVGVAPLHLRRMFGLRLARWLGHGTGVVGHVIAREEDSLVTAALWRATMRRAAGFDLVDVPLEKLRAVAGLGHAEWVSEDRCPTATLRRDWTLDDYLSGSIRKRARREIARAERRLVEGGVGFTMRMASTPDELDAVLPHIRQVYDAAENERSRQHLLDGPLAPFFRGTLHDMSRRGQLDIFVGYVENRPAAFDVLVTVGGSSHTILGRYHPEARRWGVGHLLMRAMVQRALQRGSHTLNLQIGDDHYKGAWSDGSDEVAHIVGSTRGRAISEFIKLRHRAHAALG